MSVSAVDQPSVPTRRVRRWPVFLAGLAAGLALAGVVAGVLAWIQPWRPSAPPAPGLREGTLAVCHQAVLDQLRAPATAQWSGEDSRTNDDGDWLWTGSVDAQNGFGALVRNHWECRAYRNGGQWMADNVSVTAG